MMPETLMSTEGKYFLILAYLCWFLIFFIFPNVVIAFVVAVSIILYCTVSDYQSICIKLQSLLVLSFYFILICSNTVEGEGKKEGKE